MPTSLVANPPTTSQPPPPLPRFSGVSTALIIICGILLPAITTLIEALLHMCAETFFDPLPTVGHVFAIATVPLASVVSLWALHRRDGAVAQLDAILFAQAFAVAI